MNHPFTDTYIAMAKAADEIQAMRPNDESYGNGDFVCGEEGIDVLAHAAEYWVTPISAWLPRLDQLLGMLGNYRDFDQAMERQAEAHPEYGGYYAKVYGITDWHELSLAVVMFEKFGKTWDGKAWVKA